MTTETMSPLERKYATRFDMLDADGNGVVDGVDFEMLAQRLVDSLGVTFGSPKAERVHDAYLELWTLMRRIADADGDGEITRTEFVTAMTRMAGDRAGFKRVIEPLARLSLSLCDIDGDGHLTETEFTNLLRIFDTAEASTVFRQLDTGGDGYLSVVEILEALCDFHIPAQRTG
jgi:Ca2+-binding EF-hand superfamily protein